MNKWKHILFENPLASAIRWFFTGILILLVRIYQHVLSPLLPKSCRFIPTCSEYAIEALQVHGFFKGSFLAIRRISRCHPLGGHGKDPVPSKGTPIFHFKKWKNKQ